MPVVFGAGLRSSNLSFGCTTAGALRNPAPGLSAVPTWRTPRRHYSIARRQTRTDGGNQCFSTLSMSHVEHARLAAYRPSSLASKGIAPGLSGSTYMGMNQGQAIGCLALRWQSSCAIPRAQANHAPRGGRPRGTLPDGQGQTGAAERISALYRPLSEWSAPRRAYRTLMSQQKCSRARCWCAYEGPDRSSSSPSRSAMGRRAVPSGPAVDGFTWNSTGERAIRGETLGRTGGRNPCSYPLAPCGTRDLRLPNRSA
jgi:hypothetical protein